MTQILKKVSGCILLALNFVMKCIDCPAGCIYKSPSTDGHGEKGKELYNLLKSHVLSHFDDVL